MNAIDITVTRLKTEEGRRPRAYNDKTGQVVTCRPSGNLTIGYGVNLEGGLSDTEMEWLLAYRLTLVRLQLERLSWYIGLDPYRQSVVLDIGFNTGFHGLLGFPHMIAALARQDWHTAAMECAVEDKHEDMVRYAPLRQLLLVGGMQA